MREATKKTSKLLFEIKDVHDELNILKTIARSQLEVQSDMVHKQNDATSGDAQKDLTAKYVLNDIVELDRAANQTQSAVSRLRTARPCQIVNNHCSKNQLHTTITLQESQIANLQAEESVSQGKTVMVFTLVTVWFVSLHFLSSALHVLKLSS